MSLSLMLMFAGAALAVILLCAAIFYIVSRYYEARHDHTYMTQDEHGFRRALEGKVVLWDFDESVVKGATAPHVEFVAVDPATGGRKTVRLLDARTGALNLRPQYCAPLPFPAVTADDHRIIVEPRVQFSLNRALLKHVYEIQEFSLALETRIHSAFRAEIGKRRDEELRASLHDVERAVIENLRRAEAEGDEEGEAGMALGVRFHTATFTHTQPDEFSAPAYAAAAPALAPGAPQGGEPHQALARAVAARTQGVLALRPQQLDLLADAFKDRDPASTAAILSMLEMQTRQNIAEALAASGQLIVLTAQELGLVGAATQHQAIRARAGENFSTQPANGAGRPLEERP